MVKWQGFSRLNADSEPAPSATVTVYARGTSTLSTLYAANDVTQAKANPFTAGTDGYGFFYAANGRYDIQFSGGGITTPWSLGDVLVFDPGGLLS